MEQTTFNPGVDTPKSFDWADFFSFKTMITLKLIQILYAIVAVCLTLYSLKLLLMDSGEDSYSMMGSMGRLGGFLLLIFGNVLWRVWCELIIVFFRINKTLNNIDDKTHA